MKLIASLLLLVFALPGAVRIKDVAAIEGVRDNQLVGYGLVVGLKGTGDKRQTMFSAQTLANILDRMGVQVPPLAIQVRNVAAVMITANLPPFAQPGTRIDVQVAAAGDATNLQGGLLILTPLKAATGETYAAAQGPVITGGFAASGGANNSMTVNHPTAGRIPNGAIVERAAPSVVPSDGLRLQLRSTDFTTAARIVKVINGKFGQPIAAAESAGMVKVSTPQSGADRLVAFIAEIEALTVEVDHRARIVINERTGTIVLGKEVQIRPATILHGSLTVQVETKYDVSQPAPFQNRGETVVTPDVNVGVKEEKANRIQLKQGATVEDLVAALMAIGATPRDVIAILDNLKTAGALDGDLEVI